MAKELPKVYDPKEVESRIYEQWETNGCFRGHRDPNKKPFTIVMPPPNVTGQHHMGHAMAATLQDILIRFKSARDAFYVFTGQMGVATAYAQHRFTVRGNVSETMGFVRCVDLAEGYLFPPFRAKSILKELPEKQLSSLRLYGAVLLGR